MVRRPVGPTVMSGSRRERPGGWTRKAAFEWETSEDLACADAVSKGYSTIARDSSRGRPRFADAARLG